MGVLSWLYEKVLRRNKTKLLEAPREEKVISKINGLAGLKVDENNMDPEKYDFEQVLMKIMKINGLGQSRFESIQRYPKVKTNIFRDFENCSTLWQNNESIKSVYQRGMQEIAEARKEGVQENVIEQKKEELLSKMSGFIQSLIANGDLVLNEPGRIISYHREDIENGPDRWKGFWIENGFFTEQDVQLDGAKKVNNGTKGVRMSFVKKTFNEKMDETKRVASSIFYNEADYKQMGTLNNLNPENENYRTMMMQRAIMEAPWVGEKDYLGDRIIGENKIEYEISRHMNDKMIVEFPQIQFKDNPNINVQFWNIPNPSKELHMYDSIKEAISSWDLETTIKEASKIEEDIIDSVKKELEQGTTVLDKSDNALDEEEIE